MERIHSINKNLIDSIISNYPVAMGSTGIYPGCFPTEIENLGFAQRKATFNDLKGLTVTRISKGRDRIVLGISYLDKKTMSDDEDYFVIDVENSELESFIGKSGEFKKQYPNHGEHHEDKSYLNQ